MSRPKISILLPDLRGGGAERVCVNLANAFAARDLSVEIVLMLRQGELLPSLDRRIRVVDLNASRPRHLLVPLMGYLRAARPDALLANMWPLTILAILARILSRVPGRVVAVEHTTWSVARLAQVWRTRMLIKTTMGALLPRADAVVGVSQGVARDLERFAGLEKGSVTTVYNPVVGTVPVKPKPLAESFSPWAAGPHKRVLAVGTLKKEKDFPTLLRAFALVRQQVDARLLILGEGQERLALEALVRSLGLEDSVELPGFVAQTASVYARADLFVLSSDREGFGNVIVEALEQGVPVVSTDCPSGPREILESGKFGRLVPIKNPEALAQAMLEALRADHDRDALRARAREYSVDKIANEYLNLLLPG